jgi:MoxR-like ATPase
MATGVEETVDLKLVEDAHATRTKIEEQLRKVIIGQQTLIDEVLTVMFAGGHLLMVGVPGLAKTLLVSTLSKVLSVGFKRIQFTPDMMPSDITGTEVLEENQETGRKEFVFVKGPVFTNLLLADEINRTPPKTQAALMEAMQERQVSAGKTTYPLEEPFMVMATQNPIEQEGTYPLPEAQLDRFMFMIYVDYPTDDEFKAIVKATTAEGLGSPDPVIDGEDILRMRRIVREIPISDHVLDYITRFVVATHINKDGAHEKCKKYISWGAGPRAGQNLALGAKSRALLRGNLQATIEDVKAIAHAVLRHRIVTNFTAIADGVSADDVVSAMLDSIPEEA